MAEPPENPSRSARDPDRPSLWARIRGRMSVAAIEAVRGGVRRLPRERALRLGGTLGRAYARLHGPRTSTARINLALAFPELPAAERERLCLDTYANLGRMVAETALLGSLSREELLATADIEGYEHLEAARKSWPGGGAIILTAHFGSFELFGAIMTSRGVPLSIVHRGANNPHLDGLISQWRMVYGGEVIRRGVAARAALRGLRQGRCIAMPLDQNTRVKEGIFVPFFGRPACTRDGPARLAARTGAPVVPAFMFRIGETGRHRIRIYPAMDLLPQGADRAGTDAAMTENVGRMTALIEEVVREAPTQWIWSHRRWKTQPEGMPRLYRPKADRPMRRLRRALGLRH